MNWLDNILLGIYLVAATGVVALLTLTAVDMLTRM